METEQEQIEALQLLVKELKREILVLIEHEDLREVIRIKRKYLTIDDYAKMMREGQTKGTFKQSDEILY